MKKFFCEVFELLYWSLCCPSKIRKLMREWASTETQHAHQPNSLGRYIPMPKIGRRFITQYFIAMSILILSMGGLIAFSDSQLPLTRFLLVCTFIGISLAPMKLKWLGVYTAAAFAVLGFEKLSFNTLWALPVTLISYYRVFPDYFLALPISFFYGRPILKGFSSNPIKLMSVLPPHSTELLWIPLPNHNLLLADAFSKDPAMVVATLRYMQTLALPGFHYSIYQARSSFHFICVNKLSDLCSIQPITSDS
jgi:hypothetical protein